MNGLDLYLVTDRGLCAGRSLERIVLEAVEGGVTMVQLREKDLCTREFVREAISLRKALASKGVPLIINDRVDVALACGADGVHIGQSDMSYPIARKLLGKERIIGLSVENQLQVIEANYLDVDYIGVSPVFGTSTKTDTAEPFGLDGLREAVGASIHPAVAIGGINTSNIADVMACGVAGVALVSAIIASEDPKTASRNLIGLIHG